MTDNSIEPFKGTKRFIIQRKLGSGGCGVVYQVYDSERNNIVALKILNSHLLEENSSALYRFKREFRSLTDVIHPNLINLYELIADGEQLFFTMELVRGGHFLDYINDRAINGDGQSDQPYGNQVDYKGSKNLSAQESFPNHLAAEDAAAIAITKVNFDKLRFALKQVAEGICALHIAGKLHRDIKPTNIMVTRDDRVVILDFGMVTELARKEESYDFIGTPTYMSPEHISGEPITEASDWYSVGVIVQRQLFFPIDDNYNFRFSSSLNHQKSNHRIAK